MAAADGDPPVQDAPSAEDRLHDLVRTRSALAARELVREPGTAPEDLLPAVRAWSDLALDSATDVAVADAAASAMSAADAALAAGGPDAVRVAADRATLALEVLFHRDLHSDRPDSALVHETEAFLRPLRDSAVGALLTGALTRRPVADRTPPPPPPSGTGTGPAVVIVSGPFGRFHEPVVAMLTASGTPARTVRPVDSLPGMSNLGVDRALVHRRLALATGAGEEGADRQDARPLLDAVRGADVVLADWAGKGTALLSWLLPPGSRLVVRVHSVDLLRAWLHLIDWSRVDTLVCVADHIAGLARDLLGDRLAGTRVVVVPNTVDTARLSPPSGTAPAGTGTDAARTLSMVGWAQPVKDPLWALDLLALLRREDERWRLLLIGADFADDTTRNREYARAFRDRSLQPDVREGIEYVGYTRDLPPVLARSGFAVCSSVREGHPVGLLESVAAGAAPVIRDWPMFADRGAARSLYGDWVVTSVDDAARRVLALAGSAGPADPDDRADAAARARRALLPDAAQVARDWAAVVRGEEVAVSATTRGPATPR